MFAAPFWSALSSWVSPLVLLWLAWFFGRSLRPGSSPLIERIARRGIPDLPEPLCRYTRRLTAVWCAYFVAAAGLVALADAGYAVASLAVWGGSVLLFVGERWVRPRLFPGQVFPGLAQQVRDTASLWRARA